MALNTKVVQNPSGISYRVFKHEKRLSIYKIFLIEGNGYETRQSSLFYAIVPFFGLDPAQNTITAISCLLRTEELTSRNVLVT